MKVPSRAPWLSAGLICLSFSTPSPAADTPAPAAPDVDDIIEQILALRQQMDTLLEALPPEMREEVEKRWRERQQRLAAAAPPKSQEATAEEETEVKVPAVTGGPRCGLRVLDTNGDGVISGADRQWRFLRLWFDDGDGEVSELEIESLYDLGVRQIDADLGFYVDADGDSEDIEAEVRIELAAVGVGNSERRRGVLVVDADRLAKGGLLTLTDAAGAPLSNYQPLAPGTLLVDASGHGEPAVCP